MPCFTTEQRLGAIVRNGAKLMGVGFLASMLGELVVMSFGIFCAFFAHSEAQSYMKGIESG